MAHPDPEPAPWRRVRRHAGPSARFVVEAWRTVLQREPDPMGFADALRRLDAGGSRRALLSRLARSDEARAVGVDASAWPGPGAWSERLGMVLRMPWALMLERPRARRRLRACPELAPLSWPHVDPAGRALGTPSVASQPAGGQDPALTIFTIVASNYLPQARVLMQSVARHHPEASRVVVLVDADGLSTSGDFDVLAAAALNVDGFDDMTIRYDVLEMCTAIKPFAFRHLLARAGVRRVVYLDPDIELHDRLEMPLSQLEAGASMVLTPHAMESLPGPQTPNDHTLLRSGVFNLGFMAVRCDPQVDRWMAWWAHHLRRDCRVDFAAGLFTDQRWCDFAPALVDGLALLRDPGHNVAYWNLEHRPMTRDAAGRWMAGGAPLVFFHFSGFDPGKPEELSRHQTRLSPRQLEPVRPLLREYALRVLQQGWDASRRQPYGHDTLGERARMGSLLRRFYRWKWPEPQPHDRRTLVERLLTSAWRSGPGELPPLLRFMHASDTELRCAFDIRQQGDRARLMSWFVHQVCAADGLDTLFTPSSLEAARSAP